MRLPRIKTFWQLTWHKASGQNSTQFLAYSYLLQVSMVKKAIQDWNAIEHPKC